MKKPLLLLMCIVMLMISCTKDESFLDPNQGDLTTITVKLNNPVGTRAAYAGDEELSGMTVRLFVIHVDGKNETVVDVRETINASFIEGKSIAFSQRLVKGQQYKLAVWADYGKGYYTFSAEVGNTEPTISYATNKDGSIGGSNTDRDAYVAIETVIGGEESYKLTLKRPFGMIKVTTNDYNDNVVVNGNMRPISYAVNYDAYTKFSLSTGKATQKEPVTVKNDVAQSGTWESGQLSYDYLFMNEDSEIMTYTVDYTTTNGSTFDYTFENIPLRRNYITNVSGNILTKKGDVKVTISPDNAWNVINKVEATNTTDFTKELLNAAANGTSEFVFKMTSPVVAVDGQTERSFIVPNEVTGNIIKKIQLDFSAGIDIPIHIRDEEPLVASTNYQCAVTVVVPNGTTEDKVTVNLPNAHVVIKTEAGTIIKEMTASTSGKTLVIQSGVTISTLTVTGGNVDNHGRLGDIIINEADGKVVTINNYGTIIGKITVKKGSYILTATASTADELRAAMVNPNLTGVILTADVAWVSPNPTNGNGDNQDAFKIGVNDVTDFYAARPMDGFVLDGNGHTISGVAYNNVFAVYAHNVTIKNTIIEQTQSQKEIRANNCLTAYCSKKLKLENVILRNSGKAGLIVNGSTVTATELQTSGNTWGGVNVTKGNGVTGKPEFAFNSSCTFAERPQIWIDNTGGDHTVNAPSGWDNGLVFIEGATPAQNIVLNIYSSSTITEKVTMAPDNYRGVYTSAANTNALVKIGNLIFSDGTKTYSTIAAAIADASGGDVIKLAAGTYGTATNFSEYASQAITIKQGVTLEGSGVTTIIKCQLKPLSNVAIKNLKLLQVKGSSNWADNQGLTYAPIYYVASGLSELVVDGVTFDTDSRASESLKGATAIYVGSDVRITSCTFNNFWKGVFASKNPIVLTNNTFNNLNPVSFTVNTDYSQSVVTGNRFSRNSYSDVQMMDISPADSNELTNVTTSGMVVKVVNTCTVSDNFKAFINAIRANNTWSGSEASSKPLIIRNAVGAYKLTKNL